MPYMIPDKTSPQDYRPRRAPAVARPSLRRAEHPVEKIRRPPVRLHHAVSGGSRRQPAHPHQRAGGTHQEHPERSARQPHHPQSGRLAHPDAGPHHPGRHSRTGTRNANWPASAICAISPKRRPISPCTISQFYRIVPLALRYIGGFGDIHWVKAERYQVPRQHARRRRRCAARQDQRQTDLPRKGW